MVEALLNVTVEATIGAFGGKSYSAGQAAFDFAVGAGKGAIFGTAGSKLTQAIDRVVKGGLREVGLRSLLNLMGSTGLTVLGASIYDVGFIYARSYTFDEPKEQLSFSARTTGLLFGLGIAFNAFEQFVPGGTKAAQLLGEGSGPVRRFVEE